MNLTLEGKINEIEGERLYALLREIGLQVRLNIQSMLLAMEKRNCCLRNSRNQPNSSEDENRKSQSKS